MNQPLEKLSREELLARHKQLQSAHEATQERLAVLEHQLAQLQRLVFGAKREGFIASEVEANQLQLFQQLSAAAEQAKREKVSYERQVPKRKPKRRQEFPAHLPRKTIIIPPEEEVEDLRQIGEEVRETLDYQAAKLVVIRRVQPKYVDPADEDRGVIIGPAPERPFARSIAEVGLVVQLIIDKYVDHLPLYRQARRFKRMGIHLSDSVLGDLIKQAFVLLFPLWERLQRRVLANDYLQVDETRIKVQKVKPGKTHEGYLWGYHAPCNRLMFFEYLPSRGRAGPAKKLKDFKGHLQTDAYTAYDPFNLVEAITALVCWAHVRRKFDEARSNDPELAAEALSRIQKLYLIERRIAAQPGTPEYYELRYQQRQQLAVPVLEDIHTWLEEKKQSRDVLPQSPIGKAINYALNRWEKLMVYTTDGRLEIDNNLLENLMRPIALGRKNYLFAGSHDGARWAALFYSLLGSCQLNDVNNPFDYLYDVLWRINDHPVNRLDELLPDRWKPIRKPQDYWDTLSQDTDG